MKKQQTRGVRIKGVTLTGVNDRNFTDLLQVWLTSIIFNQRNGRSGATTFVVMKLEDSDSIYVRAQSTTGTIHNT
jgi:hypothetical protein